MIVYNQKIHFRNTGMGQPYKKEVSTDLGYRGKQHFSWNLVPTTFDLLTCTEIHISK
jgi:hypothetical protein